MQCTVLSIYNILVEMLNNTTTKVLELCSSVIDLNLNTKISYAVTCNQMV